MYTGRERDPLPQTGKYRRQADTIKGTGPVWVAGAPHRHAGGLSLSSNPSVLHAYQPAEIWIGLGERPDESAAVTWRVP